MEYRILGPLEVVHEGERIPVARLKERLVLAVLLLHANEFVARERLIDELWGASPPPTARKAVNVYVSQLRKVLARDGRDPIATEDGGYRLLVDADATDEAKARQLLAAARDQAAAGELERAAERLRDALALWRGPTLAGLTFEARSGDEVARLDDLRLAALMDRIDCDLALGRHHEVLGELNVLVREHPLQERLRGQQMVALYRAGRQADALEAYRDARRVLVEELGIEPTETLQRLHQDVLRHDPALDTPPATSSIHLVAGSDASETPPRSLRRRWPLAVAAAAVIAIAAGITVTVGARGGHHSRGLPPTVAANSVVRVDPRSGTVVGDVPVAIEPGPMALTRTGLWVVGRGDQTLSRYDLSSRRVRPIGGPSLPYDVVADAAGNIWVSNDDGRITWILRAPSGTGTSAVPLRTETIDLHQPSAGAEAVGAGYLWVIAGARTWPKGADRVSLIDLRTHRAVPPLRLQRPATAIAFGDGAAWIGSYDARTATSWLTAVRAGASETESIRLERNAGWGPLDIAVGAGAVWIVTSAGTLVRVDTETQRLVKRIRLPDAKPQLVTLGDGYVWLVNHGTFSISQVDPQTNRLVRTVSLGGPTRAPCGIAASRQAVWVAVGDAYCDTANR